MGGHPPLRFQVTPTSHADQFIEDAYRKLRDLEEDIQRRKEMETNASRKSGGRPELALPSSDVLSERRSKIMFSFEDSPLSRGSDRSKQVRFKQAQSPSSTRSKRSRSASQSKAQTPRRTFSKKELFEKAKPVNMSLSTHVRNRCFLPDFDQVKAAQKQAGKKGQQRDEKRIQSPPCLKKTNSGRQTPLRQTHLA